MRAVCIERCKHGSERGVVHPDRITRPYSTPYCGIQELLQVQRNHPDLCIVVRHIPSDEYGESLKKALSYEALRTFSANAAHRFWDSVLPKTSLGIPVPYEAALQSALLEAAIAPEAFADALQAAAPLVSADIVAAQSRITSTPTWILDGIRFPACDFKAGELPTALKLARKARSGDIRAKDEISQIITRGLLNESRRWGGTHERAFSEQKA